jgi:hypothetical protein
MVAASLLILALLPQADIQGTVRAAATSEPVPYATVRIAELRRSVSTDAAGGYAIRGVPDGRWRVQASSVGYHPTELIVRTRGGTVVRMDFDLAAAPIALPDVKVVARREQPESRAEVLGGPPATPLRSAELAAVPALAEADVLRAVQTLPSVAASSDFSSALYVRGGSPDQALVMLDGMPLFNPYHVGGIFGALDPSAVASVDVLAGAVPARAGDRLGGIVDIRTRDGGRDRMRGNGGVSLIAARASVDGPLPRGRGSYIASVRRSYLDALTSAAYALELTEGTLPYGFTDAHLKVTHDAGGNGTLAASLYLNREVIDTPERMRRETGDDYRIRWGSRLASVSYRRSLGTAWVGEARAGLTGFMATFDARERALVGGTPPEDIPYVSVLTGRTEARNLLAAAEVIRHAPRHQSRAGLQGDAYRLAHRIVEVSPRPFGDFVVPFERVDEPRTLAAYVDDEWTATDALVIRTGVRVLHAGELGTAWMPRAGIRWAPRRGLAFSAGGGRYAQVVHSLRDEESAASALLAYDLLAAAEPGTGLLTGEDVAVGTEWVRGATSVRVDAYAKWLHDLPLPPVAANPLEAPFVVPHGYRSGEGTMRGVEMLARHVRGRAHWSLSYTLAAAERRVDGERYTPQFNRRHTLDALAQLPFGARGEVTARLALASGQPYTPVTGFALGYRYDPVTRRFTTDDARGTLLVGEHNSARLPRYLRLDLGARREYRRRWFGAPVVVVPYVHVLNALNTRNVSFARPRIREDGRAVLTFLPQLPFFPTIGAEWRF